MLSRVRSLFQMRFIRDTLTLQTGQFITIFVAGGTQVLLARILGKDLLGTYRAALLLFGILALLDISGAILITRTMAARALGANDADELRQVFGWFVKISALVNGTLIILFFIGFSLFGHKTGALARWLTFTELTDVPYQILQMSLAARRTMRPLVQLETARLLTQCVVYVAAALTLQLELLVFAQLAISLVFMGISIVLYTRMARTDTRFPLWPSILATARRVSPRRHINQGLLVSIDKNFSQFTVETLPQLLLGSYSERALGLFATAYAVVTFPAPLISGVARNLDTYLPFMSSRENGVRSGFIRATAGSAIIWTLGTLSLTVLGPIALLVLYGTAYLPAIPWIYPLLLQSMAVGMGVGLGSALRTLSKNQYSVIESAILTVILLPIGYWLIHTYDGYGAAWYVGLSWFLNALAGVGIVLWLTRKQRVDTAALQEQPKENKL